MNMIELPPLATTKSRGNLIMRAVDDDKKDTLMVRMNGYTQKSNFDSSASSTSKSHSSGGLLVKRSKTSNNLGTLFEQSKTPPARRPPRTLSNQRLSNRSDNCSTTTGQSRSNHATIGSQAVPKRCMSSTDLTKADRNNNRGGALNVRLGRYKSEQKLGSKDSEKKDGRRVPDEVEDEDEKAKRILNWLQDVEQYAEAPPEIPDQIEEQAPPQTDTAIHIVYDASRTERPL